MTTNVSNRGTLPMETRRNTVTMRVRVEIQYEADPGDYDSADPNHMAAVDEEMYRQDGLKSYFGADQLRRSVEVEPIEWPVDLVTLREAIGRGIVFGEASGMRDPLAVLRRVAHATPGTAQHDLSFPPPVAVRDRARLYAVEGLERWEHNRTTKESASSATEQEIR